MAKPKNSEVSLEGLQDLPGYLFRRLHQTAVAKFSIEVDQFGITPVQWAILFAVHKTPGLDQSMLSREIALDAATVGGVINRLESRQLIQREVSAQDRRLKILYLTNEGRKLLSQALPIVLDMQKWLLSPLTPKEQVQFTQWMLKLINRQEES
jgi:DNA-binding MarR family transcriptional regulator